MRVIILLLFSIGPAIAAAVPCEKISDKAERLACYEKLAGCLNIKDSNARLACLDEKAQDDKSSAGAGSAAAPATSAPPTLHETAISEQPAAKKKDADADFGLPKRDTGQMTSTIVKIQRRSDGVDFITLANHQVWRETLDQTERFKVGQQVTIKPAIFGSYTLTSDSLQRLIKVHRVK